MTARLKKSRCYNCGKPITHEVVDTRGRVQGSYCLGCARKRVRALNEEAARPKRTKRFCLWVSHRDRTVDDGRAIAEPERYSTYESMESAWKKKFPTGRTGYMQGNNSVLLGDIDGPFVEQPSCGTEAAKQ